MIGHAVRGDACRPTHFGCQSMADRGAPTFAIVTALTPKSAVKLKPRTSSRFSFLSQIDVSIAPAATR
jgi:hypothetical protein